MKAFFLSKITSLLKVYSKEGNHGTERGSKISSQPHCLTSRHRFPTRSLGVFPRVLRVV